VPRLIELGFDVNHAARQDAPIEQEWETALHVAAGNGDVATAQLLLAAGADPNVVDHRFDATPLGWAEHFEQPALVELLAPLTGDSP
jgi:siroheme synthase (precorrin-2 oxidase/ferrochelatase)